jgi:hypothetical protein
MFGKSFDSARGEGAVTDVGMGAIRVHTLEAVWEQSCC